jgi:fermentation-respiration switch protein FrsA (DUF1100 family)
MFKSIFSQAVKAAKNIAGAIGGQASITQVIGTILGQLPKLAQSFSEFAGADVEHRIRAAWEEFDAQTGLEGADIVRSLPAAQEELLFDGIKQVGLVLSLWAAGVYGQKPELQEITSVSAALGAALTGATVDFASDKETVAADEAPKLNSAERRLSLDLLSNELRSHQLTPDSFMVKDQLRVLRDSVLLIFALRGA